jgi:hypothetical protein
VLQKEKDVALHDRALDSLRESTGKRLPDDPKEWNALLHQSTPEQNAAKPKEKERSWGIDLVSWFIKKD